MLTAEYTKTLMKSAEKAVEEARLTLKDTQDTYKKATWVLNHIKSNNPKIFQKALDEYDKEHVGGIYE